MLTCRRQHARYGYAYFAQVCSTLKRVGFDISHPLFPSLQVQTSDSGIQHPVFSRKEAEEWCTSQHLAIPRVANQGHPIVYYQDQVIKRVKSSVNHLREAQGHLLSRRPFQVNWFSSQLAM